MKLLEEKIKTEGKILDGEILKVDAFLNHRIDVALLDEMGKEFYRLFKDGNVNKILTIEASGIAIACMAARYFGASVVFAKKDKPANIAEGFYHCQAFSYTHKVERDIVVSKAYLGPEDRVLIIDDFLATGEASHALCDICKQAGATLVGVGVAIEKEQQNGGNIMREKGIRVEALAKIKSMDKNGITFFD